MLITNGRKTRNISEKQLPEYEAQGYEVVRPAASAPPKPPKKKTGD